MTPPVRRFLAREHAGLIEVASRWLDATGGILGAILVSQLIASQEWLAVGALQDAASQGFSQGLERDWFMLVVINLLLTLVSFQQNDLYRSWRGRPYTDQFSRLGLAWLLASLLTLLVWRALGLEGVVSLDGLLVWCLLNLVFIASQRAVLHLGVRYFRRHGANQKDILVYGAGSLGRSILDQIAKSPESGFRVLGFIDDRPELRGEQVQGVGVLGGFEGLEEQLDAMDIDEIWVALPLSAMQGLSPLLDLADRHRVSVRLFPDIYGLTLLNHSVSELLGFPTLDLNVDQMQGFNGWVKNAEDKVLGSLFLLITLPVLAAIALTVRLSSPGPVIFKQRRHGWDGNPFTIYKFRTMHIHKEPNGQLTQAQKNDGRFTLIGRWLRRTSLDELPQLVNVLQGRMSLVGPRPHAIEHNEFFSQHIQGYMRRHRVKPGITGWAQINDLRGETQTIEEMSRRVKHDMYYIEHWSLWFDLRIILTTILKLFFSRKAW